MSDGPDILSNDDLGEPTSLIVRRLVEILGARLCAVIGDVNQTSTVREWIDGVEPTVGRGRILRIALRVAEAIEGRYWSATAQSWFQAANHALQDEAPALVLKHANRAGEAEALDDERLVIRTMLEFLDL